MAKTPTERIIEFSAVLATFEARLEHCDGRVTDLAQDHKEGNLSVGERCKQYEMDISHLKRDIEELKKWKAALDEEQKETKKWHRSFGPSITAAIMSIILAPLSVVLWNWLSARLQLTP